MTKLSFNRSKKLTFWHADAKLSLPLWAIGKPAQVDFYNCFNHAPLAPVFSHSAPANTVYQRRQYENVPVLCSFTMIIQP
jgi:hypothetical protein